MRPTVKAVSAAFLACVCATAMWAQAAKPGPLSTPELKQVVPSVYYFRGQSATVQVRNSSGFRASNGKLVLVALVDTSGYAQNVAEKYQGMLITEIKLNLGGTELAPGAYGFGFVGDNKFIVMDVGANDLMTATTTLDEQLQHPVPLKLQQDGNGYRFYSGRKWVAMRPE
ncbi:MAG TPA: hypothetical protein VH088_08585 [Terriglobales bacterium]|nr:hypothetical protein [Terriglobales bacterium]